MMAPTPATTAPTEAAAPRAELTPTDTAPSTPVKSDGVTSSPTVRVEGLAETLHDVRHELQLLAHASKYSWVNQRLILLRNALIALSVLVFVVVIAVVCYREAYRQTLTIAAFDVPAKLAERGITGQVVAKALFDELIKRRELVTTLESGELKGAWAENRADVAIPEAKFTLQSLFRYLRYMTGNEIAIDGEIILDGDDATLKVRVAGKPPTVVKGKLAAWESLVGELAIGVLDVTQPAVLAAYLGIKAQTPDDIKALSKHIVKMQSAVLKPSAAVMSVAYDAYGSALQRQARVEEAKVAFAEAMALDPSNGVAVIDAAKAQSALRNYAESSALYLKAKSLRLPDSVKATALRGRILGASNTGDCTAAEQAVREAKTSSYSSSAIAGIEAIYIVQCEFEESRAVALVEKYATLHPDAPMWMNNLGVVYRYRPEKRYLDEGIKVFKMAIANGMEEGLIYANLAYALAEKGEYDESQQMVERGLQIQRKSGGSSATTDDFDGYVYYLKGEYAKSDAALRRFYTTTPMREEIHFLGFAGTQAGLKRYDEAIKVYNDGLARLPKNCLLWEAFGGMYAAKGDVTNALATFDKGINAIPKCGLNYNSAARLLIKQNRTPEAKQKLDALIKIAPNSDGAVIAKEISASIGAKP